jgi:hypothetical protein
MSNKCRLRFLDGGYVLSDGLVREMVRAKVVTLLQGRLQDELEARMESSKSQVWCHVWEQFYVR